MVGPFKFIILDLLDLGRGPLYYWEGTEKIREGDPPQFRKGTGLQGCPPYGEPWTRMKVQTDDSVAVLEKLVY